MTAIDSETPLRLAEAAKIAFPDGGMTVSGLRREFRRGRLVIERVAGKDFVTLAAIEEMRRLCRLNQKVHTSGSALATSAVTEANANQSGSSATETSDAALAALDTILDALKKPSPATSQKSAPRRRRAPADVIHLRSR